jgi:hypothetical protein
MKQKSKRLILIELNEINFDVVKRYLDIDSNRFPSFNRLFEEHNIVTSSETRYEDLEPWIQWVSVHTCKTYEEHEIFRLGDIIHSETPQIFEQIEASGHKVGVISAMNAANRLVSPSYFVPDPWTNTSPDPSFWSRTISQAVSQTVNDNASARVTPKSAIQLIFSLLRFARIRHLPKYFSLAFRSRNKPWLKALFLDLFLHDVHWSLFKAEMPAFSTLFLNAGAHIQHHYFFQSKPLRSEIGKQNPSWYVSESDDPIADVLELYDLVIGDYLSNEDSEILISTGLSQKPYDRLKYYYRLNDHEDFLKGLGIKFRSVSPRMTRDFLVDFDDAEEAGVAQKLLAEVLVNGVSPLFGEIDNRGNSLFVTLTYPNEITDSTTYSADKENLLLPHVNFVAIKNGMHQGKGFAFFSKGMVEHAPVNESHVAELGNSIKRYFNISC